MRENISKLEDRLERLKRALDRRRSDLARLEAMRDSARSDSYRKRIDDWIEEERSRIAEIEGKIEQVKAWILKPGYRRLEINSDKQGCYGVVASEGVLT